jgi:capsular polysaccharide biosynthesis protein
VKRAAVIALCALGGLAVGGIWTLLQTDSFRADARVLVRPHNPAVAALAQSSLIESNIAQTLHLSSPPNITASEGDGGVLTVSADGDSRERARQVDAEAVVILTQKVPERFPGARATVLDPAHVAEQTSPTAARNLLITGVAGLLLGIAAAATLARERAAPTPAGAPDPRAERRLQRRIDQVAQRERALAQRAGQLAAREQDLARRERALEEQRVKPEAQPEPEPAAEQQPQTRSAPEVPMADPVPATPAGVAGTWTLGALETLTRERSDAGASQERQQEWSTYLFLLREHAEADGTLPASFDQLVNDVFGPLPRAE